MKAVVVKELGASPKMALEERPMPKAASGHTLVKMHAALVNPLSNQVRCGMVPVSKAPIILSNAGSGIVEESGRFEKGTPVAVYGGGTLGIAEDGLQQEHVVVEDRCIVELPETFDLDEGAALTVNYLTAYQAMKRKGQVRAGQKVLISGGSGAVGNALIQMALALDVVPIALVSTAEKVESAHQTGAAHVIDMSSQDVRETVMELTDGAGADLAFDTVGGDTIGPLVKSIGLRGAVISIGFVGGVEGKIDLTEIVISEKRILGYDVFLESDDDTAAALQGIRGLIEKGFLRPMIDSIHAMEEYEQAYERLTSRRAKGAVLLRL